MSEENTLNFFQIYIIPIVTYFIGILTPFLVKILSRNYDDYRDAQKQKSVLRGDLKARIKTLCDKWEDRNCMITIMPFRNEVIDDVQDIRESLNDEFAQLKESKKTKIRELTRDILELASKFQQFNDTVWCKKVEKEMDELCKRLRDVATDLD